MLKLENIRFQQRLDPMDFTMTLRASVDLHLERQVSLYSLNSYRDKERAMEELHAGAIRHIWGYLYDDLRRPFYELKRMAHRSEFTNYHELREVSEHLDRVLNSP